MLIKIEDWFHLLYLKYFHHSLELNYFSLSSYHAISIQYHIQYSPGDNLVASSSLCLLLVLFNQISFRDFIFIGICRLNFRGFGEFFTNIDGFGDETKSSTSWRESFESENLSTSPLAVANSARWKHGELTLARTSEGTGETPVLRVVRLSEGEGVPRAEWRGEFSNRGCGRAGFRLGELPSEKLTTLNAMMLLSWELNSWRTPWKIDSRNESLLEDPRREDGKNISMSQYTCS